MSEQDNGGPAFPQTPPVADGRERGYGDAAWEPGMSLRDYFAAKAMPLCYRFWMEDYYHPDSKNHADLPRDDFDDSTKVCIAEYCYDMADAMLKARSA